MLAPRRPPIRSQAGAALTIPFIVVIILFVAALGLWWVANDDIARFEALWTTSQADKVKIETRLDETLNRFQTLSNVVGWRDASQVGSKSDPSGLQSAIDSVKGTVGPALGSDDATLEQAINAMLAAYQASQQSLTQIQSSLTSAEAARKAAEANINNIEQTYKAQLATLNQQLSDEQARADNQGTTDQQRFDELLASEQNKESDLRQAQRDLDDAQAESKREMATAEATIQSLAAKQAALVPSEPDGRILSVSDTGSLAYIDIGGRDGLQSGTRFEVLRRGKSGELLPVGSIEVREVESDMAMVGVLGSIDATNPLLTGDLVRNPHFRRGSTMHFYLLGEFPLTLSREFIVERLSRLGGTVDDALSANTDVVIMGHESLAEGEFAQALTTTDDFIMAESLGLRIMRLDELSSYLRY